MSTVSTVILGHLVRAVGMLGGDVEAIFGEDARRDTDFDDRIAVNRMIELWERAVARTGRRDLPSVALRYSIHDERSLIGFVVANQLRFGDSIDRFDRFSPTISDAYRWRIADDGRELRAMLAPPGPIHRAGWQHYIEYEAIDIVRIAERLTGGRARPLALRFLHAAPPAETVAAFAAAAGGLVPEFGCDRCEVVYPSTVRELAVPGAQPALAALVEARLEEMLAAIERGSQVTARARAAIAELLERRTIGVDELARGMRMSRRTLERALELEGTSASALLEEARTQRALTWLPTLTVEEVATRLGYSDVRAFARAFKRWTGVAPGTARRR